jgi:hypothetical protein
MSRRWNVKRHIRVFISALFCLVVFFAATGGFAQLKTGQKTTVTGCLQKGDKAQEFSIAGEDGKTYQIRNSAVDLSKHIGHKVTVTGTFEARKKEGESTEYDQKQGTEVGQIRVTALKMVSEKCH